MLKVRSGEKVIKTREKEKDPRTAPGETSRKEDGGRAVKIARNEMGPGGRKTGPAVTCSDGSGA